MSITSTTSSKKSLFQGRKLWFGLTVVASIVAAGLALLILSQVMAKDTYYVLNQDIPARTEITTSLLTEVETSRGGTPPSALTIGELTTGERFSLSSLKAGDVLTNSNTGDFLSLSEGLPSDFVVASFIAQPSSAAGGNVNRGDYIDIIALMDDPEITGAVGNAATYVLQRALVIDATVDLDSYSAGEETTADAVGGGGSDSVSSNTADTGMRAGVPTLFTVGLSPENAAVLALATQYDLFVVLSSADSVNDGTVPSDVPGLSSGDLWNNPRDAGIGTDNTFGQGGDVVKPTDPKKDPAKPSKPSKPGDEETVVEEEVLIEEPVE